MCIIKREMMLYIVVAAYLCSRFHGLQYDRDCEEVLAGKNRFAVVMVLSTTNRIE
jgi:hypothetical protein